MSFLIIERGKKAGTRVPLSVFPIVVGRDKKNSLSVDDHEVSRHHFRIKKRGRLYILEDMDSRNGTYLNGDKIINSVIQTGDKILIGHTEFTFITSETNLSIQAEIDQLDMIISDDLGLTSPLTLKPDAASDTQMKLRINPLLATDLNSHDLKSVREVFDYHSNIMTAFDMDEAASVLLKSLGKIASETARAAFFIWHKQTRRLTPKATRHFSKKKLPFHISRRTFEDVIVRKQGVILQNNANTTTESGKTRLILPILQANEVIAIVHLETDHPLAKFNQLDIEKIQALLLRSADHFENLLLKNELDSWVGGMIETLIATLEAKDTYTFGHSERVSHYCIAVADELKLSRDVKRVLLMSSICHDIGKVGIPDAILKKAGSLSSEEYEEMKLHPTIGAEILKNIPNVERFISGVKYHHEKWDGSGYPEGLEGENIPFFGRIVGLADAFDAMVSGRSYSGFMDQTDAVQKLSEENDLFDPYIVKAFSRAYDKGNISLKTSTQNNLTELNEPEPSKTSLNKKRLKNLK